MKIYKFKSLSLAESFANRCKKLHLILFGDCPFYYVANFADAQRLVKAGYELVN